jgi:Fe-S cluster assembly ATP-binding protein
VSLLKITNLKAGTENKEILHGINLEINPGEVHAIMGPNGSGKTTLASVLTGKKEIKVFDGTVEFEGKNLLELAPEERARMGLFLAFQYPVEIPGVSNANFLRLALNEKRKYQGLTPIEPAQFFKLMREKAKIAKMDASFLNRGLNEGFSGGEKKRNEIFQMIMLEPKLAILDETDSGLDIDALKIVAEGVNQMRDPQRSFLIITHYQRLLDYIVPDFVHVLYNGKIVMSGNKELALELEAKGYDWIREEFATNQ